jgi:O-antigen ligase
MRDDLFIPVDHSHYFLQDRGAAYSLALHCVAARPFFGFGPGGWMAAASQYSRDPQLRTFFHYLQFTHEDYLQTLVEWGLVGGLLCAVLVFGGLAHAMKNIFRRRLQNRASSSSQAVAIGAVAALAAILTQSLIDFPLQIPVNTLYACALLGMCWARDLSSLPQPNRQISV